MALTLGTNCGFVTTAPTANPSGTAFAIGGGGGGAINAMKDVADSAGTITQLGIWIDAAADAENIQLALYSHDSSNDKPDSIINNISVGTASAAAWNTVTVSIPVTAGTTYWLAVFTSSTDTDSDRGTVTASRRVSDYSGGDDSYEGFLNTWNNIGTATAGEGIAIYALIGPGSPGSGEVESEYLLAKTFGFALTNGCTPTSISARVNVTSVDPAVSVSFTRVQLYYNGAFVGNNVWDACASPLITSAKNYVFGAALEEVWGYDLTEAIAEHAEFGIGIAVTFDADTPTVTLGIAEIELTISYTTDVTSDFEVSSSTLLGDRTTGIIYQPTRGEYRDYNTSSTFNAIRTVRRTGHITHGSLKNKRANRMEMRVKKGIGNANEESPDFILRWRDNYDKWSGEKYINLGGQTDTYTIAPIFRLGTYKTRQYEIEHSDPTDFIFVEAEEEVELLEH